MLDFSKAFDTIDHQILLSILHYIGLSDSAIGFIANYIGDRYQRVCYAGKLSNSCAVTRGVPQGSILGPLLFSIYTSMLPRAVKKCNVHLYADDTQIYYFFEKINLELAREHINSDLQSVCNYANKHGLTLNPAKSSMLVFGDVNLSNFDIRLDNVSIQPSNQVKSLGIVIDRELRFSNHITFLLKKAYSKLKLLFNYRHLFDRKTKTLLCESLVLSHFNYCDYVYGPCLTVADAGRVQRVQNSCLRYMYGIRKYERISYTLPLTGWLDMARRRQLHSTVFYYRIVVSCNPPYLYNKIKFRTDIHNINIRRKDALSIPRHYTTLFRRSFSFNVVQCINGLSRSYVGLSIKGLHKILRKQLLEEQLHIV